MQGNFIFSVVSTCNVTAPKSVSKCHIRAFYTTAKLLSLGAIDGILAVLLAVTSVCPISLFMAYSYVSIGCCVLAGCGRTVG